MNENTMRQDDPLRQQLWDLVYGLLTADETTALHAQIKSDPAAARLYAEVRLQADLVAAAAQVDDPSFTLSVPGVATKVQTFRKNHTAASAETALRRTSGGMNWLAGIAAAALSILLAWGLFVPRGANDQLASRFIVTEVQGPANIPAGLSNSIEIHTRDMHDRAQRAEVFVSLVDAEGRTQFGQKVYTNDAGTAAVELPGATLQEGVRLQVSAANSLGSLVRQTVPKTEVANETAAGESLDLVAALPVQPEPVEKYLAYDKPSYEAGETVNFAMIPVTRFSRQVLALPEFGEATPEALVLGGAMADRSGGMGGRNDEFEQRSNKSLALVLSPNAAQLAASNVVTGSYAASDSEAALETGNRNSRKWLMTPQVAQGAGGYGAGSPATDGAAVGGRGGALEAKPTADAATAPKEELAEKTLKASEKEAVLAKSNPEQAKQQIDGLAANYATNRYRALPAEQQAQEFSRRRPGESSLGEAVAGSLYSEAPADALRYGVPPMDSYYRLDVLNVPAGQPIELDVPVDLANRKLLATAVCDDVVVAREQIAPAPKRSGTVQADVPAQRVKFAIPKEVAGDMVVRFYDQSQQPPVQLREQAVYREPEQKWNIAVSGQKATYAPGESVRLSLKVTNEAGLAEPAALAVRVWNDQLAGEAWPAEAQLAQRGLDRSESLAARSYYFQEPRSQRRSRAIDEQLTNGEASPPLPVASESDVREFGAIEPGTNGLAARDAERHESEERGEFAGLARPSAPSDETLWLHDFDTSSPALAPAMLADNRAAVTAMYETAWAESAQGQETRRETLGRICLLAGVGVLLLLAIQGLLRLRADWKVLLPTVALAMASLAVGLLWLNRDPLGVDQLARSTTTSSKDVTSLASNIAPADSAIELTTTEPASTPAVTDPIPASPDSGEASFMGGESAPGEKAAAGTRELRQLSEAELLEREKDDLATDAASRGGRLKSQASKLIRDALAIDSPNPAKPAAAPTFTAPGAAGRAESVAKKEFDAKPGEDRTPAAAPLAERPLANLPPAPLPGAADLGDAQKAQDKAEALGDFKGTPPPAPSAAAAGAAPASGSGLGRTLESQQLKSMASGPAASRTGKAPTTEPASADSLQFADTKRKAGTQVADQPALMVPKLAKDENLPSGGELKKSAAAGAAENQPPTGELATKPDFERKPAEESKSAVVKNAASQTPKAPASLYWNPQLTADAQGRAVIEFTMPEVESEYRILIDAYGNGRLGSAQEVIFCRKPE